VTILTSEFDDGRLDDPGVLTRHDEALRGLAGLGARIRVEAAASAQLEIDPEVKPRGIVLAGYESRLIRSVIETTCPAPLVAWPYEGLPGWVGPLDLVAVQASGGAVGALLPALDEAVRRGCSVLVAGSDDSALAEHVPSRGVVKVATKTDDPLAAVVAVLDLLYRAGLGPSVYPEGVADAADMVAEECSPHKDLSLNPAKGAAIALADAQPLVWGGSGLAARAARRIAEEVRRQTGRPALASPADDLATLLVATPPHDPFADLGEQTGEPVLVTLDDGDDDAIAARHRATLENIAESRGLHVVRLVCDDVQAGSVGRYVSLLQQGLYIAAYLGVGMG